MSFFNQKEKICILSLHSSCENSSYKLSQIETFLRNNGYEFVEDIEPSNVVIINTCAYSDQMQSSNEKKIREIVETYPEKRVIVFGCLIELTNIKEQKNLFFIKNSEINKLSKIFYHSKSFESCQTNRLTHFNHYQDRITLRDSFIQICQGCSNNCSYCNIKLSKGVVKSKPIEQIKEETRRITEKEIFEITLLSDDCGSYGHDIGTNIVELMNDLKNMDSRLKFKIYTIFPGLLLRYYQGLRSLFETRRITYICLPLQSASSHVLKLMNRDYNLAGIREIVEDIKALSPDTYLFTHFIINFPDESFQDFLKSIEMAKLFNSSLFLPYQENKKTRSYSIFPKGTSAMLSEKIEMLLYCIRNRDINAVLVRN